MSAPVSTCGSVKSDACSRMVAGSSVEPERGRTASSAALVATASASEATITRCQSRVWAIILPAEVMNTMATENAA